MERRDWLALAGLSLLWGGSFPLIEVGLQGFAPITLVWIRVAVAALVLGIYLKLGHAKLFQRNQIRPLIGMALLNSAIPFSLLTLAQDQITGALAAVLNATTPLFTMVVAHFLTDDDRMTLAKGIGLGLGIGGVFVMMSGSEMDGEARAMALCLGAACSYGFAGVWGRRLSKRGLRPQTIAFGQVFWANLLLLPIVLFADRPWERALPDWHSVAAVLALACFSTVFALLIFFRLLSRVGPTRTSVVTFLVPVTATGLGAIFLNERLEWHHWTGFALVLMGLAAVNARARWTRAA